MSRLKGAPRMRRIVITSGLSLAILAGYRAVLAEPKPVVDATTTAIESARVDLSPASATVRPTPVPSSLHLLAMGLLLVPAAHKFRWILR